LPVKCIEAARYVRDERKESVARTFPRLRACRSRLAAVAATTWGSSSVVVTGPTPPGTGVRSAWAGHSVEVLMRIYARCMTGLEDVWISRMDGTLHLEDGGRR